jgi:hypothetical protein
LPKLTDLTLQFLDPINLSAGSTCAYLAVAFGMPSPDFQRLRDTANLGRNRSNRSRLRLIGALMLGAQAAVPLILQRYFLKHCLLNLLVGNSDNHGKNGSVLHQRSGTALAPLYGVVPAFIDWRVGHQQTFRHATADFSNENLRQFLIDPGFDKLPLTKMTKQIAVLASKIAAALAPRTLPMRSTLGHGIETALGTGSICRSAITSTWSLETTGLAMPEAGAGSARSPGDRWLSSVKFRPNAQ